MPKQRKSKSGWWSCYKWTMKVLKCCLVSYFIFTLLIGLMGFLLSFYPNIDEIVARSNNKVQTVNVSNDTQIAVSESLPSNNKVQTVIVTNDTQIAVSESLPSVAALPVHKNESSVESSWRPDQPLPRVYAQPIGGLGNQLWIFLSCQGLARQATNLWHQRRNEFYGTTDTIREPASEVIVPPGAMDMLRAIFDLSAFVYNDTATNWGQENWTHYRPGGDPRGYDTREVVTDIEVLGYLQNPQYLVDGEEKLKARNQKESTALSMTEIVDNFIRILGGITILPSVMDEGRVYLQQMGSVETATEELGEKIVQKWVGVHLRRYPDRHKPAEGYWDVDTMIPPVNQAMRECQASRGDYSLPIARDPAIPLNRTQLTPCCVIFFSNDPTWVVENFVNLTWCARVASNEVLKDPLSVDGQPQNNWATNHGRDLAAMVLTDYMVLSTGTYGHFAGMFRQIYLETKGVHDSNKHFWIWNRAAHVSIGHVPDFWVQF